MASRWAAFGDRFRLGLSQQGMLGYRPRPVGVDSGRWVMIGPLWIRLGSRSSWQAEDEDAKMIKPVEP